MIPTRKDKTSLKVKTKVRYVTISTDQAEQRIDNYLITLLKGLPKSRLYRLLRKGEIRVNKRRITASYRLIAEDVIRLPPISLGEKAKEAPPSDQVKALVLDRILYEDNNLLIINKPPNLSVHCGNTVRMGVIETLKHCFPKLPQLELAHRLDSETSGCLILAKKKRILRELHELLREGKVTKIYWALTQGVWAKKEFVVDLPLQKNFKMGGKHVVEVDRNGKEAKTIFRPLKQFADATLIEARLLTGRTHQIRVHAQSQGHPIAGDDRYGDMAFNKRVQQLGLKRMFLHAYTIDFTLPSLNQHIKVVAPLDPALTQCIQAFEANH